jgi:hypothetical protein
MLFQFDLADANLARTMLSHCADDMGRPLDPAEMVEVLDNLTSWSFGYIRMLVEHINATMH